MTRQGEHSLLVLTMLEVREPSGAVLLVTSDAVAAREAARSGDSITARPWVQQPLGTVTDTARVVP